MRLAPRIRNVLVVASLVGGIGAYIACTDVAITDVRGCTAGSTKECTCESDGHASTAMCFPDGTYAACACGQVLEAGPLPDTATEAGDAGETATETATEAADETADAAETAEETTPEAGGETSETAAEAAPDDADASTTEVAAEAAAETPDADTTETSTAETGD